MRTFKFFLTVGFFTCMLCVVAEQGISKNNDDARKTVQLINHLNWMTTNFLTCGTRVPVLSNMEYDLLDRDKLRLDYIKDDNMRNAVNRLLEAMAQRRLNYRGRVILDQATTDMKTGSVLETFNEKEIPDGMEYFADSSTWQSRCKKLRLLQNINNSVQWQMRQKMLINSGLRMDSTNQPQGDVLRFVNIEKNQKKFIDSCLIFIRSSGFDSEQIIAEADLKSLAGYLAKDDVMEIYEFIKNNQNKYSALPAYWYFRGIYALETENAKDAANSFSQYQNVYFNILKKDKITMAVAMNKICLLLDQEDIGNEEEIERQLKIITANATEQDWDALYFCSLVYFFRLGNDTSAEKIILKAVKQQTRNFENAMRNFLEDSKGDEVELYEVAVPSAESVFICRSLLIDIWTKKIGKQKTVRNLAFICKNNFLSNSEIMFYFSKLKDTAVFELLMPTMNKAKIVIEDKWFVKDKFSVQLPMQWFFFNKVKAVLRMYSNNTLLETLTEEEKDRVLKQRYVDCVFRYDLETFKSQKTDRMELELKYAIGSIFIDFDHAGNIQHISVRDLKQKITK